MGDSIVSLELKNSLYAHDFENKVAFFDIDGVLAPFRFNGHITHLETSMGVNAKELESGVFKNRLPSRHVQSIVKEIKTRKNVVITGYIEERDGIKSTKERDDKEFWIRANYPEISDIIFVRFGEQKAQYIVEYCNEHNINIADAIFIDDELYYLKEAERLGISSWHTSSLMDFYKEEKA